jgi:mono/diheme cytochrome c family protein
MTGMRRMLGLTLTAAAAILGQGKPVPATDLARGQALYAQQCAACHGVDGRGDGEAAYLLNPKPRDLRAARYRLVSTWEGVPTDDDLLRTITRGIPGSAMPSWGHLPELDRRALVAFLKSLAERPLDVGAPRAPADGAPGAGLVTVPAEPADAATNRARAEELFAGACASCHGADGRGDGGSATDLRDAEGKPTRPRDLTSGVFKTNPTPDDIYRRVMVGMPGTPMPGSDWAYGDDGWYLVRYILSLSSPVQRERAEMRRYHVVAPRVARLPTHPDDNLWERAPAVHLHLMPLWWRYTRPEEVVVRALHDGHELALLLVWTDDTHDATAMRPQDFRDAAAVMFALAGEPPFFAMGQPDSPVNIWMWKAERQADQPAFQDLEKVYPNLGIDSYPNFLRSPLEQPHRHALTVDMAPLFATAWGAGNIVADPVRRAAVEDLRAEGFGTLRARPLLDQAVVARGGWEIGSYRAMLRRSLKGRGPDAVRLRPGRTVPVAFAIWNGAAGDRDGKKSVTIWQDLHIQR